MALLVLDNLPLGFRFHPTDEELVDHYLKEKIAGRRSRPEVIPEVDICKCEPWDLPGKSNNKTDDREWFFFSPRARKYPNGQRSNRSTEAGYWKATGKDRPIKSRSPGSKKIGTKQTLVFYTGRSPNGQRTSWIIHEYRANEKAHKDTNDSQDAFVICRLFSKSEEKTVNPSGDVVGSSGLSPVTGKSSPEDDLPLDTEDITLRNGILVQDTEEGSQNQSAITDSRELVNKKRRKEDIGTSDLLIQGDTECSYYMGGPDQDASVSSFDLTSRSPFHDGYEAGILNPYPDANYEQGVSSMSPISREQWQVFDKDEAEATEARGSIKGPVHDARHKMFPEQEVTPPADRSTHRPPHQAPADSQEYIQSPSARMVDSPLYATLLRELGDPTDRINEQSYGHNFSSTQSLPQAQASPWQLPMDDDWELVRHQAAEYSLGLQADRLHVRAYEQGHAQGDRVDDSLSSLGVSRGRYSSTRSRPQQAQAATQVRHQAADCSLGLQADRLHVRAYEQGHAQGDRVDDSLSSLGVSRGGYSSTRSRPQQAQAATQVKVMVGQCSLGLQADRLDVRAYEQGHAQGDRVDDSLSSLGVSRGGYSSTRSRPQQAHVQGPRVDELIPWESIVSRGARLVGSIPWGSLVSQDGRMDDSIPWGYVVSEGAALVGSVPWGSVVSQGARMLGSIPWGSVVLQGARLVDLFWGFGLLNGSTLHGSGLSAGPGYSSTIGDAVIFCLAVAVIFCLAVAVMFCLALLVIIASLVTAFRRCFSFTPASNSYSTSRLAFKFCLLLLPIIIKLVTAVRRCFTLILQPAASTSTARLPLRFCPACPYL